MLSTALFVASSCGGSKSEPDADIDAPDDGPPPVDSPSADEGPEVAPGPPAWKTHTELPYTVTENTAAAIGTDIYILGGFVGASLPADVWRYDTSADTYAQVAPLPINGLHHASLVAVGQRLFVVASHIGGGFTPSDRTWRYDALADSWTEGSLAPEARGAAGAAVIDDLIYVVGGVTPAGRTDTLVVYDPEADAWDASLPPMPTAREHIAACALNGELHVFGGRVGGLNNLVTHEVYDVASGEWSTGADMPTARSGIAAAVLDGRCHVFGGEQDSGTFDENEAWSVEEGWTTFDPMPTARHGLGAATVGGRIYVVGGGPTPGFSFGTANESFGL